VEGNVFIEALRFSLDKYDVLLAALGVQFYLVFLSSILTIGIGMPLGITLHQAPRLRNIILKITGTLYTIPILAMFGLLIPIFGIGTQPALIALTIYGLLPILQNTYVGIAEVSPAVKEAARGMGASNWQILREVELPLAAPIIIAGIRTSVVMNISVATFAVFIGAGGMGTVIMQGMRTFQDGMLIAGTLLVAMTTVLTERILNWVQNRVAKNVRG
jgi:osmoprotectant transport system permease protein